MSPRVVFSLLWLMFALVCHVSGLVMVLVAWGVGAKPKEIRFHVGREAFAFHALGIRWSFSPLFPFGPSLRYGPTESDEEGGWGPEETQVSFPRRCLLIASPFLGMVLLALVCLPPPRGLVEVASGFRQVVDIFSARERVSAFFRLFEAQGFQMALGVLSAKLAALNLLPVPPLAGYFLLRELWRGLFKPRERTTPPPNAGFAAFATAVVWVLRIVWGVSLCLGLPRAHSPP